GPLRGRFEVGWVHTISSDATTLNIGNSEDGTLTWRIENTIPWLDVAPTRGVAPSTVSLRFNCNVSGPGNLSGSFTIESDNATNSPVSITVGGTVH
ncbi:MAG: hypothetical protein K1563_15165, partial [Candidatus Thiodiazotropha sp. (ex. Lucinisca nassula)]|nr:hypothetical protein [Candidatus Thiodiazotropha sp. (ex. Lucinisca nassula)]MBW9275018.1 hypothetical protein [Candidatus Thiodiazotropha sp. (ex. Lucinisca nassula)]